ncbi:MAG: DMT family transporter [Bacteroidota bacterium]
MTPTPAQDYAKLHFIVLIWGFTAILGALITVPAVEIVFYRTLISFLALGALLYFRRQSFRIGSQQIFKILGTGVLIALHWILFFASAQISTVSVCLAGMATCSFWTSFIEPALNKRKIRVFEVVLGLVVIVGLYIIFRFEFDHVLGLSLAVVSAMLSALFSVINGKLAKRHNPYMITFYEMIGAWLGTLAFIPIYVSYFAENGQIQWTPSYMDWLYLSILALFCTVYAYSVSVELMKRISAFVVNLTVNLEPVYGIILALLIFGEKEQMGSGFYLGTLIILLSVLAYPVVNKYYKRKALPLDNLR